jgi:F-type H+-transporting ATPase subunit a
MDISIEPEVWFNLPLFGMEFHISDAICVTGIVSAILIVFALVVRFVLLKKFKVVPKGFQNVIELFVEKIYSYCEGYMHGRAKELAPYIGMLALYLGLANCIELIGLRPPTTNISTTFAMAIITFMLINYYGVKEGGILGRFKHYAKPVAILAPIKMLTDLALPISLASRLYGNILAGLVVMEIVYNVLKGFAVGIFAVGIPAALSIYFNLFDGFMQTFIFVTLTLVFISEGME